MTVLLEDILARGPFNVRGMFEICSPCFQKRWKELSKEDQAPSSEQSPPHPTKVTTEKYNGNSIGLENKDQMEKINTDLSTKVQDITDGNIEK